MTLWYSCGCIQPVLIAGLYFLLQSRARASSLKTCGTVPSNRASVPRTSSVWFILVGFSVSPPVGSACWRYSTVRWSQGQGVCKQLLRKHSRKTLSHYQFLGKRKNEVTGAYFSSGRCLILWRSCSRLVSPYNSCWATSLAAWPLVLWVEYLG